jgi:hypothetical protein
MRRAALPALLVVLLAVLAAVPALGAAPRPGDADIARATALQAQWGRCPTAAPAARVLRQAVRTTKPVPRARRARAAVRAWTAVARECARPVPMPVVTP